MISAEILLAEARLLEKQALANALRVGRTPVMDDYYRGSCDGYRNAARALRRRALYEDVIGTAAARSASFPSRRAA